MIAKTKAVFHKNITSYIFNRLDLEPSDAVIANEVMNRFPVWIGLYECSKEMQCNFISFLVHGMRTAYKMGKGECHE